MPPRALLPFFALVLTVAALSGCCRQEFAGVLVFNDTDKPVAVVIQDSGQEGRTLEPGEDFIFPAAPGEHVVALTPEGSTEPTLRPVTMRMEDLVLISVDTSQCLVMADYTRQYEGDGQVTVLASIRPQQPGRIQALSFHNTTYYGPTNTLPADIRDDETLVRFTHAPCELLDQPKALTDYLYKLK